MLRKGYGYVSASTRNNHWSEIEAAFNDFVDIDIMELAVDGDQYNQLAEATDRLLAEVKEILGM